MAWTAKTVVIVTDDVVVIEGLSWVDVAARHSKMTTVSGEDSGPLMLRISTLASLRLVVLFVTG